MAATAGLATLEILRRPGAYEKVFATGRKLMEGIGGMLKDAGLPAHVIGVPPLFDIVYAADDVSDYRGWLKSDAEMQKRFNRVLRAQGVLKGDSKFYVSLAHDEQDVRDALAAVRKAVEMEAAVPAQ